MSSQPKQIRTRRRFEYTGESQRTSSGFQVAHESKWCRFAVEQCQTPCRPDATQSPFGLEVPKELIIYCLDTPHTAPALNCPDLKRRNVVLSATYRLCEDTKGLRIGRPIDALSRQRFACCALFVSLFPAFCALALFAVIHKRSLPRLRMWLGGAYATI